MPPRRSALALLDAAAALTLSLFVQTLPAAAASGPRDASLAEWVEVAAASDPPEPASDDEKQRVPKTPPGDKGRAGDRDENKDDKKDKKNEEDKKDDGDDSGSYLGDTAVDDVTSESSVSGPPEALWVEGSLAIVRPADSSEQAALVWSDPGGEEAGAEPVIDLPVGSDVVVHDSRVLPDGLWLYVSIADAPVPLGWMRAEDLVARRPELSPLSQPPFGVVGDFSWFVIGPEDVRDEYDGGGWRTALQGFKRIGRVGRAVLSAGYSWAKGKPEFNYVTPTQIDYPHSSLLQVVDLGLSAGLGLPLSARSDFRLDVGPMLCWVRESAEMDYDSLQGGVVVASGHREESLEEWRIGGQLNMGLGIRIHSHTRIGLLVRAFAISWNSESQKSLTLDFIGTQPLVGGGIGISLGY